MRPDKYQELTSRTEAPAHNIIGRVINQHPISARLIHACFGICTEAGELTDAVKKWLCYGKGLDKTNVKEELGDLLWYMALACNALNLSLDDVMECNIAKLRERFKEKYTDLEAHEENRDREAVRSTLTSLRENERPGTASAVVSDKEMPTISFGDALRRDVDRTSYDRLCGMCQIRYIHRSNSSQVCPDCAAKMRDVGWSPNDLSEEKEGH